MKTQETLDLFCQKTLYLNSYVNLIELIQYYIISSYFTVIYYLSLVVGFTGRNKCGIFIMYPKNIADRKPEHIRCNYEAFKIKNPDTVKALIHKKERIKIVKELTLSGFTTYELSFFLGLKENTIKNYLCEKKKDLK